MVADYIFFDNLEVVINILADLIIVSQTRIHEESLLISRSGVGVICIEGW